MTENTAENHETAEIVDPSPEPFAKRQSLVSEFYEYLMENKKWWMIPIIIMVVLFGLLLLFLNVAPIMAPFIYPLI